MDPEALKNLSPSQQGEIMAAVQQQVALANMQVMRLYRVSQKNWTLGFLPFMVFPVTCEHFLGHLNILGGSFSKVKSCQVIIKLFHLFLPNFDPENCCFKQ